MEELRNEAAKLLTEIKYQEIKSITLVHIDGSCEAVLAYAEGLALANYQFLKYRNKKDKNESSLEEIRIACPLVEDKEVDQLQNLVDAVYKTRDLINEPLSGLNAEQLASEISKMGKDAGFSVEILNKKKIESLKMGGLLAVNRGSIDPPTFTILEYKPAGAKNKKPVILVGKGVVFDTGGLSLKPTADSMDYMKCDMSGAAAVAGTFYAIAKSRIQVHIIGLVPATDNRPDGNAYAPGDVINMYDGTTVEVLNTDAEGRMILADALSYAKKFKPSLVIDLATLTGAAAAAIGAYGIVSMGNADKKVMKKLNESGNNVYERLAEFPFWDEYADLLKSDIADLKNIGGKYAGAITAGKFLEHFTDYPYIHLDIAGPAFIKKNDGYRTNGGTGTGVRLLFDFLKNLD
ncbi:MAG: leucyl aminopeptidase [Bacteroidales bacterium]|nr:leucyl aminopeptidase [Bacteroidales bacterium]